MYGESANLYASDDGAWACMAHGLQCLWDGHACCPTRAMQLVQSCNLSFLRVSRFTDAVTCCFILLFTGLVHVCTGWCEISTTRWESCKDVHKHVAVVNEHLWRTLCLYSTIM
jgi:hypothetical protein